MPNPHLPTLFAPAFRAADRHAARIAWSRQAIADLAKAHKLVDEAWDRRFAAHPDADDTTLHALPPPPEEARLETLLGEISAAAEQDRWPRHLYWGDV